MKKFHEESDGRWPANENLAFQEGDEHGPRETRWLSERGEERRWRRCGPRNRWTNWHRKFGKQAPLNDKR